MKASRDVVVVAGLGGSLGSIRRLIQELPPDFPASILVILQEPAQALQLGGDLAVDGALPFLRAHEGQRIRKGYVYLGSSYAGIVVRPWGELGLEPALANDSRHIGMRRCFNSAADVWGDRVIVVLMGRSDALSVASLSIIGAGGGLAIVEDASPAAPSSPPDPGIDRTTSHHGMGIQGMAALLTRLVGMPAPLAAGSPSRPLRDRTVHDF